MAELQATVNNIEKQSVAQKCVLGGFMSPGTTVSAWLDM